MQGNSCVRNIVFEHQFELAEGFIYERNTGVRKVWNQWEFLIIFIYGLKVKRLKNKKK
jgi:hypothetical protein